MSNHLPLNSLIFGVVCLLMNPALAETSNDPIPNSQYAADLTITVPASRIEVRNFTLTPLAPNTSGLKWPMRVEGEASLVDRIDVYFSEHSSQQVQQFERVIINITLDGDMPINEEWSFSLGGMQYIENHADYENCIDSNISSDGKTLILIIKRPTKWQLVDFYFIAKRVNKNTGEVTIFESPDPSLGIGGIKT